MKPRPSARRKPRRRAGKYRLVGWWLAGMAASALFVFFIWQPFPPPAAPSPPPVVMQPSGAPAALIEVGHLTPARVTYVADGDTIEVTLDGRTHRLRYIGMDTPERDERFYRESTKRNRQLVGGQIVYLEKDVSETDRYGRLLRYVYLADGRMVNELLVHEGLAQAATFPPDVRYANRFRAAQREAQQARRGMWGG